MSAAPVERRSFLTAGLAATVAITAVSPALAASPALSSHYAELDGIDRETARLNAVSAAEAEWTRWEEWSARVWSEIEALPPSPENAKLKARAIWSIVSGDVSVINEGQSTCCRIVRQVITGLAAGEA